MPNQRAPGVTPRTVAIPDEMWHDIQQEAKATDRTASQVVRAALEDHLHPKGANTAEHVLETLRQLVAMHATVHTCVEPGEGFPGVFSGDEAADWFNPCPTLDALAIVRTAVRDLVEETS